MITANWIEGIWVFDQAFCLRFSHALLHFLWQGCVVALLALVVSWCFRHSAARVRYAANLAAMLLMVVCVPITFALIPAGVTATSERQTANEAPEIVDLSPTLQVDGATAEQLLPEPPLIDSEIAIATPIAAEQTHTETSSPLLALASYVTAAYLLGVVMMTLRFGVALWGGHRLKLRAIPVDDGDLLRLISGQARRIGMKVTPAVAYCERIVVPVVVGVFKPTILLPASLATGLGVDQLEAIVTHELAHVRRLDLLVNLVQRLVESLLFFHPAVWYVSRTVSIERENCCDDVVVTAGYERLQYAGALIRMAELCSTLQDATVRSPAAKMAADGESSSQFKRRVMRLLGSESPVRLTRTGSVFALLLFGVLVATPVAIHNWVTAAKANAQEQVAQSETGSTATSRFGASLDDLLAGLDASERAIRNLSVTTLCRRSKKSSEAELQADLETRSELVSESSDTFTEHWIIDSTGRGWNKATGKSILVIEGKPVERLIDTECTYDGRNERSIRGRRTTEGEVVFAGRIDSDSALSHWGESPFEFTTTYLGTPVSEILRERGGQVVGEEVWDGHSVVVVDTSPVENAEGIHKRQFWIDPKRNHVVVRRRNLSRGKGDAAWRVRISIDSSGHQQFEPGLWLPRTVNRRSGLGLFDLVCTEWKVNDEIPESRFQLSFPAGMPVSGMRKYLKSTVGMSQRFFVVPVTTELQRWRLRRENTVAYARVDAASFIDGNTGSINTDRFDFDELQLALWKVRAETEPGELQLVIGYGRVDSSGHVRPFVEAALNRICRKAGFDNVKIYSNIGSKWEDLPSLDEAEDAEDNLGNEEVLIFPVRTRLGRHLTGVDCSIYVAGEKPGDAGQILSDREEQTIRDALQNVDFGEHATAKVFVSLEEPQDENVIIQRLPRVKQGSPFHDQAVSLLKSLGFAEVVVTMNLGGSQVTSRY